MSRASKDQHSWPYSAEIVDDGGNALPTFERGGQSYVLGTIGQMSRRRPGPAPANRQRTKECGRNDQGGSEPWLRATAEPFRQNGFAEPPPGWRR